MSIRRVLGAGLVGLAACHYTSPGEDDTPGPDAGACLANNRICSGDQLSICAGPGAAVQTVTCSWGCDTLGEPHCKRIAPTGGGATIDDLDPVTFAGIVPTFSLAGSIDGGLGSLAGQDAASAQVGYTLANGIAVFRFRQLQLAGVVFPGGGGGAVGWIRINTRDGTALVTGTLSPNFTDPSTTATQGTAVTD